MLAAYDQGMACVSHIWCGVTIWWCGHTCTHVIRVFLFTLALHMVADSWNIAAVVIDELTKARIATSEAAINIQLSIATHGTYP